MAWTRMDPQNESAFTGAGAGGPYGETEESGKEICLFLLLLAAVLGFLAAGAAILHGVPPNGRGGAGNATPFLQGGKAQSSSDSGGGVPAPPGKKPERPDNEHDDYKTTAGEDSTDEDSTTEEDVTEDSGTTTYCETAECQHVAYLYDMSVGGDVGPCQNAYLYVCGRGVINVYGGMIANVTNRVYQGFVSNNAPTGSASRKALAFYNACSGRRQHDRANLHVITSFFSENGLTFAYNNATDPLDVTLRLLLRYDVKVFFYFKIFDMLVFRNKFVIVLEESQEFVSWRAAKSYFGSDLKNYQSYVQSILSMFGISDFQTISNLANRIHSSETVVFSIRAENNNQEYGFNTYTLAGIMQDEAFQRGWRHWLSTHSNGVFPKRYFVASAELIRYFVNNVFARVAISDLNVYIAWDVARQLLNASGLTGSSQATNEDCYQRTKVLMKHAVTTPYLMSVVNTSKMQSATAVARNVREKIENNMRTSSWLDEPTKTSLIQKLRAIRFLVGYPKGIRTRQDVEDFYSEYPEVNGPFLRVFLDVSAARVNSFYATLTKSPADLLSLDFDYLQVSAFYKMNNIVYIPAGTLLSPEYNYGAPPEINYGHLGKTLAHEIMHAFDASRRSYDEAGKPLVWTQRSDERYQRLMQCHQDSIRRTPIFTRTLGDEYQADIMAQKSLYDAYKDARGRSNKAIWELRQFSPDQIFFLGRCFLFCTRSFPSDYGDHPNYPHRCNVPLANSYEFAAAFNCPVGSPENPATKCVFW